MIFGLDVSHHQPMLDWPRAWKEGVRFAIVKATEGSTFQDPDFNAHVTGARNAGMTVAAYHYVKSNVTAAAQVANVVRTVPPGMAVIPDIEANSGGVALARDVVKRLEAAGYDVPFMYLPRWYWVQIGSPSLAGLPTLWSSRYPDTVHGTIPEEYADVPATYWVGYGGLTVGILQFTSSAKVAGYEPLDANAYPGTIEQLTALFSGDDMSWDETWTFTPAGSTTPITVKFGDIVGNMFVELFYGSATEPWKGPSMVAMMKDVYARQVADLDEELLAEKLAAQGITGATPAQVKDAVKDALREGTGTPPPAT